MSKIIEKFDDVFKISNDILSLLQNKINELSEIDKELSGIYHKIEGYEITHVSQSHKFVKELKSVLIKRRTLKLETRLLQTFNDNLKDKIKTTQVKYKEILNDHENLKNEIKERAK